MQCKSKPPLFKKAVSAFLYEEGVTVLISKFKNGSPYLKELFADKISERLVGFPEIDCITYVPLTKKSAYKRGYNQSKLLAKSLSKRIQTPLLCGAIKRIKSGKAQKGLTGKQRIENVKGAFKVVKRDKFKDKNVLLVDDILTTGSTVNEISRILLKAGAKAVYVATAASVEYKPPEKPNSEAKNRS
ncbi:MAG: ComF family protein [Clostridiales bacterium]|nr:ComF family protein [Clostridiales bacterium]